MFAFSWGCFTLERAKEMLGDTWEYKYRHEIGDQKLNRYDTVECERADRFREITLDALLDRKLSFAVVEYWMRLRRKHGLSLIG